jgi:tetratricopeptide (TPR) repeat protein
MNVVRRTRGSAQFGRGGRLGVVLLPGLILVRSLAGADGQAGQALASDTPELHLGKGYQAMKNDRYQEAAREFEAALALDPQLVLQARFPLAVALFELGQREEARRQLEAVRSKIGDHPSVMYYLGRLELTEGNFDAAVHDLSRAAPKPPFPDTDYYLGSAYLKKGELGLAGQWLRKAAERAPRDSRVQDRLGLLYRIAGRKEEAEKAFARAAELRKRELERSRLSTNCTQELETATLEKARPVCEQLFDPRDPDKLTSLGTIYGAHQDYVDALRPLRRAAELDPKSCPILYNLGLAYFRLGRYAAARPPLEKAAASWPDLYDVNALLGAVLYRLDDQLAAYRVLSHAHELNPENAETEGLLFSAAIQLARESLGKKQFTDSVRCLETATELRPGDPEPHRLLAEAYGAMGQGAQAAKERREAGRLSAATGVRR